MKTLHWFLLFLATVVCVSCTDLKSEWTPYIQTSAFLVNPTYRNDSIISAEDTIIPQMGSDGIYVLDTIKMGDMVAFQVAFGSYGNDLIAARITHDTLQWNMVAQLGVIQSILLPTSNVRLLQLEINPGCNYLTFPVVYTPMKSGVYEFMMTVESDSQYSPRSAKFRQVVR